MSVEIGKAFGRWTVLRREEHDRIFPNGKRFAMWICVCSCGTERGVLGMSLLNGTSQSCGCLTKERSSAVNTKHGEAGKRTVEYSTYRGILSRCFNKQNTRYRDYGGRGITVCDRWLSYENFLEDMGRRPSAKHSFDRIDNEKGYYKENCRWALAGDQMTNRRNTLFVDTPDGRMPLAKLAKIYGIPANTLRGRLFDLGWPLEKALSGLVRQKAPNKTAKT